MATPQAPSACTLPAAGPGRAQLHPGLASDVGWDGAAWPGPRVLSVRACGRSPEEEPSSPHVCAASLTAGAQGDTEEKEVTPFHRGSGSVISPGPARTRGYDTLGSLSGYQQGV